jgi:signal transduction histidine kinase
MSATAKPYQQLGFAIGLVWLSCLAAQAVETGRSLVDAPGQGLRAPDPVPVNWWPSDFWPILALVLCALLVACALLLAYRLARYRADHQPAFTQQPAGLLAQARLEVGRLEALLELRAEALQTAQLAAYEASRDRADLLGCVGSPLQQQADELLGDAAAMVRAAAGDGAHENIIFSSATRLHGLVAALLAYARTGQAAPGLQPCATSLAAWLQGLAAEAEAMAGINANRFDFRLAGELAPGLQVDRPRLRPVLLELLHNAAKFTRNGRITFSVEPRLLAAQTLALVFTVKDTGKGIDAGHLPRIFEPFARCGAGEGCQGAGLAMARHWAGLIDAELVAASAAGQGTTMRLTVPVAARSNRADQHGAPQEPGGQPDRFDRHGPAASAVIVPQDAELLAQLSGLVSMGAISDLLDWAHSPQAGHASCSLARAVADFAGQADLQGLAALLAAQRAGQGPASSGP